MSGTGGPHPPEKLQKYRFFSNTGPGPLYIHKTDIQHSMFGHHRHASKTQYGEDGPLIVVFVSSLALIN